MKKIILLFYTFTIFSCTIRIYAQTPEIFIRYAVDAIDLINTRHDDKPSKVKGSPYLNKDFVLGEVYYVLPSKAAQQLYEKQTHYDGIPFRYNAYLDEMEYYYKDNEVLTLLPIPLVEKVIIGADTFLYKPMNIDNPEQESGYFHLLKGGKVNLLLKYSIKYEEGESAQALQDPKPPEYDKQRNQYFVELENGEIHKIKNIKKLISLLGKHESELTDFAKKEKISRRNISELKAFIEYFNSL